MENDNAVVVANQYSVTSTPEQVRANVNLIQKVMQGVMQRGVHFDTIPGCGPKPTLLKPGAEKLCATFLLAPDPVIEDLSTPDERRYRITCRLIHSPSGTFMGSGIGEASSEEDKYKWRKAVHVNEFNAAPEDRRRIKYLSNGDEIKQVRANIADIANTVLKMGKKRALVDGVLTVTGASDMFTQDIEDMEHIGNKDSAPAEKSKQAMPERKSTAGAPEHGESAPGCISESQAKRFFAIYRAAGKTNEQAQEHLKTNYGIDKSSLIKKEDYDNICAWAGMKE